MEITKWSLTKRQYSYLDMVLLGQHPINSRQERMQPKDEPPRSERVGGYPRSLSNVFDVDFRFADATATQRNMFGVVHE